MKFNPTLINLLLIWIGGIAAVQGLTEKVKGLWKNVDQRLKKILNYGASVIVCLIVTGLFLFLNDSFSVKELFLYAVPIWLTASGIYDAYHVPKTQ
ncbi:MAG TPA: hypothetical protein PKX32_00120 [Candidatus Saccharicenans sp.]|nr:hypothetical protein [Candidatus Saccharicenans sp.]